METDSNAQEANAPTSLKYLTVQDVLWINLQATKKVHHFNFAKLEEATFYQYGYGPSRDLARQAGRLIGGFIKLRPFEAGNDAVAFIAGATFLLHNGKALKLGDNEAAAFMAKVKSGETRPEEALWAMVADEPGHTAYSVHEAALEAMARFPETIASLSEPSDQALAS